MKPATVLMVLSAAIFALTVATRGPAQTEIAPAGIVDRIDHYATGFPLEGGHERVACESCHRAAVFKGTPRTCANCHNNVLAEGKGFRHIPTAAPCATCHSVQEWRLSRFDHTDVTVGCVRCHNNFTAPGKTATHPPTGNVCEDCHRTVHWNLLLREVGAREPPRMRSAG